MEARTLEALAGNLSVSQGLLSILSLSPSGLASRRLTETPSTTDSYTLTAFVEGAPRNYLKNMTVRGKRKSSATVTSTMFRSLSTRSPDAVVTCDLAITSKRLSNFIPGKRKVGVVTKRWNPMQSCLCLSIPNSFS